MTGKEDRSVLTDQRARGTVKQAEEMYAIQVKWQNYS
jgi:hypothetical protein